MIPYLELNTKAYETLLKVGLPKNMGTLETMQTWIGHNATHYHGLTALPHAIPNTLLYIFSQFNIDRP